MVVGRSCRPNRRRLEIEEQASTYDLELRLAFLNTSNLDAFGLMVRQVLRRGEELEKRMLHLVLILKFFSAFLFRHRSKVLDGLG